jgi:hypothetical protein
MSASLRLGDRPHGNHQLLADRCVFAVSRPATEIDGRRFGGRCRQVSQRTANSVECGHARAPASNGLFGGGREHTRDLAVALGPGRRVVVGCGSRQRPPTCWRFPRPRRARPTPLNGGCSSTLARGRRARTLSLVHRAGPLSKGQLRSCGITGLFVLSWAVRRYQCLVVA